MGERDWWVAVTNTRMERRATQGLEERGFGVWWPRRVIEFHIGPKRRRRLACRMIHAMPGYLFIRPTCGVTHHAAFQVDGVRGLIAVDEVPLRVADDVILCAMRKFAVECIPVVDEAYRIGDKVLVEVGPGTSFEAIIDGAVRNGRLTVLSEAMGRSVRFEVDRRQCSNLEAA